jgi:hypothetical protein
MSSQTTTGVAPELSPPKSADFGDVVLCTCTRGTVPMGQCDAPTPGAQSPWDSTLGAIEDNISQCTFLQMTYTAEKPTHRLQGITRSTPTSPPDQLQLPPRHIPRTHHNRMTGRQMSCHQQTVPPQSRCSKDVTAHPHWPRACPRLPCAVPACSVQPLPGKRRLRSPGAEDELRQHDVSDVMLNSPWPEGCQ